MCLLYDEPRPLLYSMHGLSLMDRGAGSNVYGDKIANIQWFITSCRVLATVQPQLHGQIRPQ